MRRRPRSPPCSDSRMSPPDELDDDTRALVLEAASRLLTERQKRPFPGSADLDALEHRVDLYAGIQREQGSRMDGLEARLVDIEDERSLATVRMQVRRELDGKLWTEVRSAVIRWGIPAIIAATGWALVQFVRSVVET